MHTILRAAVPAAALALLLTGCGPDNGNDPVAPGADGAAPTATAGGDAPGGTPTDGSTGGSNGGGSNGGASGGPSAAASAPGGSGGGSGSYASPLGPTATGTYTGKSKADLAPVSTVKGNIADLAPLKLAAGDTNGKTPYYITVSYTNRSGATVADDYFMQRVTVKTAESGDAIFQAGTTKSIAACAAGEKPAPLADGQTRKSCGIYLVPTNAVPKFLVYGSIMDTKPLIWKLG
ncbi:hypothetical protein OG689_17360 [Kitasatospora sp. NBC_00240]|uniref:hypothetical protein n=1 Tax=Kitasatospora sp. NBC_00240 TaxID=2903567 RepID=UPI00225B8DAA|nr:hypothetical protein [Kitasatospora sp. NBC_00240]MCX5211040.1 hypothetical protein [Kitasatospora sp. NBC_00240]